MRFGRAANLGITGRDTSQPVMRATWNVFVKPWWGDNLGKKDVVLLNYIFQKRWFYEDEI